MVEMKYISVFLIIPFCIASSGISAEIFEQVHNYDVDAFDIESGDFNNDGLVDFVVVDFWPSDSSYYEVFLSNGDCSFTGMGPLNIDTTDIGQVLTGDFNEDSNEDLLMMSLEKTWFYAGDGTGVFALDVVFPWSYCSGCTEDINNDGHIDIVGIPLNSWITYVYGYLITVMLGDGTGGFTEGWVYDDYPPYDGYYSSQLAFFDNSDTFIDLCVPCCFGFLTFEGIGDGSFNSPNYHEVIISSGEVYQEICTCSDFNEDGYTDIAVAGQASMGAHSTYILLNNQDGTFEQFGSNYFSGACGIEKIATADLDLDGHLDLSLAMYGGSIAGYGDGTFGEYLSSGPCVDFVFMDIDLDGDLDLADRGGRIYRNTTINLGIEGSESGPVFDHILEVSPNPFSSSVTISASGLLNNPSNLQIFNLSGRLVAELKPVSGEGQDVYHWNGVSSSGTELPSGIYTVRLSGGDVVATATPLKLE